jgi:peptide chain release factor 1
LPLPPDNAFKPIPQNELEVITQCGKQGAGGQNVNKVASAVRMKHIPTGISVFINGRDQHRNRKDALKIITTKVNDYIQNKEQSVYSRMRRELMDGSRGNKIRTYNLLEHRITDHRTNRKVSNVDAILKKGQFELLL